MSDKNAENDARVLMKLAKEGDAGAFGRLYELYFTPVYRYIYFRVNNRREAEDLAQVVFLKAYKSVGSFKEMGKEPLAYFFTIARNAIIDCSRKKREILMEDWELRSKAGDSRENIHEEVEKQEFCREVHEAIGSLTEDQQEVVVLKFINDLSNMEIARITGKTEEAIRQSQCRALKNLRKLFEDSKIL